jgi:cell division protease FtsH
MAGEANVPFFTISGSEFVEMFVGVGARRVRDMFEALKDAAPAILFIDEIDAVGGHRAANNIGAGNREADQTLNQLLTEMDGFDDHASIMVIGATNRPDSLDPALLRPGRFDRIVSVNMPDVNARTKILEVHTKGRNLDDDIDLHVIAKGTPGFSGADLENLVNEAAMLVAKDERTVMTMADLDGARDRVMMGREKSLVMDDKEKEMTAYHEAGHAIVGHNVPEHDPIYKISIVPRGRALGVTMYLPEGDRYSHSRTYKNSQLISLMGGRAAEEIKFGENAVTTGASNDLERATIIARDMVTKWGFSDTGLISFDDRDADLISEDTRMKIDEQVRILLDKAYKKAKAILNKNKRNLKHVADALIEKETIDQLEFVELIGAKDETLQ